MTSSQPANTSSPVFCFFLLYALSLIIAIIRFKSSRDPFSLDKTLKRDIISNWLRIIKRGKGAISDMMPFGLKIAIVNRAFRKKLDEKASAMGLTSVQLRVLGSISRLETAGETEIHQIDLERIEHVTHPAMTKLLGRLESKGFVRCVPSTKDRRYKKITCTEKSAGIHEVILAYDKEVLSELCQNLTPSQKKTLIEAINIMVQNIDMQ